MKIYKNVNSFFHHFLTLHIPNLGGGTLSLPPPPCRLSLNISETIKAITVAICSIQ